MNLLTIALLTSTAMPTPAWLAKSKPMPHPAWLPTAPQSMAEAVESHHPVLPVPTPTPRRDPIDPIALALKGTRLPGPSHWRCTTCGSSSCLMYLGAHLRSHNVNAQRMSTATMKLVHDNIHNSNTKWKPTKLAVKAAATPKATVTRQVISQPTYYYQPQQWRPLQRIFCRGGCCR